MTQRAIALLIIETLAAQQQLIKAGQKGLDSTTKNKMKDHVKALESRLLKVAQMLLDEDAFLNKQMLF